MSLAVGCQSNVLSAGLGEHVVSISEATVDSSASAQEGAPGICRSWTMTAEQAEQFFKRSESIDERRYHHDFDTAPCMIAGTVDADEQIWKFVINGAAKASWSDGKEVRYFGCTAPECKELVMWEYVPPDVN